jgi:serine/threonine protein phosphatase PrpC
VNREVNEGAPELRGRVELGSGRRKTYAGCAKLNDTEHGLFGVAQGSGEERIAALVAKDMVWSVSQELGSSLDRQIQNNLRSPGSMEEREARVDALVETKLKEIFLPTIAKVRSRGVAQKEFEQAGVRASIVKLVELSPDKKRLYISHLGDARVYVFRGGRLTQMTRDDTGLAQQVDAGFLTPEAYEQIDQTRAPAELSHAHQQMFPLRHDVVSMTGKNVTRITPEVEKYDVHAGDRLVIVNGTIHHNLTTRDIQNWMSVLHEDLQAEDVLQRAADDEAGKKNARPARAEAGDLAAVVYMIRG